MLDKIIIEEVKISEYGRLKDIINKQQLYHYNLNGPYKERFLKINEINFQQYMSKKNKFITYAAIQGNRIIGFASANINNHNEGYVEDLFIEEQYRNNSIGKILFKTLLDWLKENFAETVEVHISSGNESVIEFYEKYGFRKTGYTMMKLNK